jgi:hypothetical protein
MGRIWFLPVLLVTWVCGAKTVHACSCTPRSTTCGPPGEFWRASDVFTGRVIAIARASNRTERRVTILVSERWRGNPHRGASVEVFTRTPSLCGYPFRTGREYLIYGSRTEDGRITVSLCSRTSSIENAAADVSYARAAAAGNTPAGRIVGEIRLEPKARRRREFADVRVTVRHGAGATEVATDRQGRYSVELTSSGRHELQVALPETIYAVQPRHVIEVPNPHACVERHIDVRFNGRLAGRVIDAGGRGVAGLIVTHRFLENRSQVDGRTSVLTRDDGSYEIERLAPGPFEIGIELPIDGPAADAGSSSNPARTVSKGMLGEGERLLLAPYSMPADVEMCRLEGTVVGGDGWSMADARVFLKGELGERLLGLPAVSDSLGRFVLAVVEGQRYQVFAERPSGDSEFSEAVAVTAERGMTPLRLVVRRRF